MNRLIMFVGMTIGSYAGWWVGESLLGFGLMGNFIISGVGSLVGVYAAWKVLTNYLE